MPPMDQFQDIRSAMVMALAEVGVQVEVHHHEVVTAGQTEVDMRFDTLTRMADKVLWYKYCAKNTALRFGKTATFMPEPIFQDNGSGMHTHQSLWKKGKNLFYDPKGYAGVSKMCLNYIGGILKHAPALCALIAPTTNSYRRLVPGYEPRSTSPTARGTARPACASRYTRSWKRPSGSSFALPIPPAIPTSPLLRA